MRHALIIVAAVGALSAPLAVQAQGRSDHGRWREVRDDRGRDDRGRNDRKDRGRDDRNDDRRSGPGGGRYEEPRNAPPPYQAYGRGDGERGGRDAPPPAARSVGRGQYLAPNDRGAVVRDPGRYRLRTPPPGYDWVTVGPDIYLVQRGSGLVLDAIPGGH